MQFQRLGADPGLDRGDQRCRARAREQPARILYVQRIDVRALCQPARALGVLSSLVQRESNTLAYIDGFWLTVWFAIGALILVAMISPSPKGPLTPARN